MRRIFSWIADPRYHTNRFANVPIVRHRTWRSHWLSLISSTPPAISPDNGSNTIHLPTNHCTFTSHHSTQRDHRQRTWRFHFRHHHYRFNHSPSSSRRICINNGTPLARQTIMVLAACVYQFIAVLQPIYLARALYKSNKSRTSNFTWYFH